MEFEPLNNPGWFALNSFHSHLAIRSGKAARYPADVLAGAALAEYNQEGLDDLRPLVQDGEAIGFFGTSFKGKYDGWRRVFSAKVPQMVCEELRSDSQLDAVRLDERDVPEMLELIALAQPGPFLPRTIILGDYWGIRRDGKLVAMAGERLHMTGFCEVSAVCTHPEYRGRGYGGGLTTWVARNIMGRGEIPFLHHDPANHGARRLYEKLGFYKRRDVSLAMLLKNPTAES